MSCMRAANSIGTRFGASLVELRVGALVIGSDPFFNTQNEQLATLALRDAVPAIYQYRDFAAAGGLMSYGMNLADLYRPVGVYTGRLLRARSQPTCRCSGPRKWN